MLLALLLLLPCSEYRDRPHDCSIEVGAKFRGWECVFGLPEVEHKGETVVWTVERVYVGEVNGTVVLLCRRDSDHATRWFYFEQIVRMLDEIPQESS